MNLKSLSGLTKAVIALSAGGVLAGTIALGESNGNGGGASPPAQVVTATPTNVPERTAAPRPTLQPIISPNHIAPDQAALSEVARRQSELQATSQRCPDSYLLYESMLLGGSFCYPPTWKLVNGDIALLPMAQRPEGYSVALQVSKPDPVTGREVTFVAIAVAGQPYTRTLDCPTPGLLQAGSLQAKACFRERRALPRNSLPGDVARIIHVSLPHKLPDFPETIASLQVAEQIPGQDAVSFSSQDQAEGLEIIASIRCNP